MNTVPTVIRLTSKLQGEIGVAAQKCPICLGKKDSINNLLEVGSTISKISKEQISIVGNSDEWFPSKLERSLCFGCKRICIEALNKALLLQSLPDCMLENA